MIARPGYILRMAWSPIGILALALVLPGCRPTPGHEREEVVFWHFWGGADREVVEGIVEDFNLSQSRYHVRAVAMPGNNLDLKFFLSVAGGDPPDLLNQDDPVVADWAHRGVLTSLESLAEDDEVQLLEEWLFPAARQLGSYKGKLYALCNGLDIRALYCNTTFLEEHGLRPPERLTDLDQIAETVAPAGEMEYRRMGYLPDPRRLWAWGVVFGGQFWDANAPTLERQITADAPEIIAALQWMAGYSRRYGPSVTSAFRSGDQALTGAAFPLLADRRYAVLMDGQWRVRDIEAATRAARAAGQSLDRFTVVPLPPPQGGRQSAGWVNGNFFVVPKAAKCKAGAWQFMKFWSGFQSDQRRAAEACVAGGWIPASQDVVDQPIYQQRLRQQPLLRTFIDLARSEHQYPTPAIPAAAYYQQQVHQAAGRVMYRGADPAVELREAARRVRTRLAEVIDGS